MEWVRQSPFLRRMELALCRPSRFHGGFCYYYNQSPCCPLLSSGLLSGRVLTVWLSWEKSEACSLSGPLSREGYCFSVCPWLGRSDCHACSHQGREIDGQSGQIRSGGPFENCGNTTCETRSDDGRSSSSSSTAAAGEREALTLWLCDAGARARARRRAPLRMQSAICQPGRQGCPANCTAFLDWPSARH